MHKIDLQEKLDIVKRQKIKAKLDRETQLREIHLRREQLESKNSMLQDEILRGMHNLGRLKESYHQFEAKREDQDYVHKVKERRLEQLRQIETVQQMELLQIAEISRQSADLNSEIPLDRMSYQEILEFEEKQGSVSRGLTQQQLGRLPTHKHSGKDADCNICFDRLALGALAVRLRCRHEFHKQCAVKWLGMNKVCPVCKQTVIQ